MTKNDRTNRPSPKRRSDGPSEQREDRRASSGSEKRHASGSDKHNASGSGRSSSRPSGRAAGAQGDQRRPRRDGDQKPARPAGPRGESRDRDNDQRRSRHDEDKRPARSTGPRGEWRDRDSDQRRSRSDGDSRERAGEQRPRRDGDQRPERQSDRREGFKGRPEGDRQQHSDAGRRHGERPERDSGQRPAGRAEAAPAVLPALPDDILPGRKPVRELIEQSPQSVDDVILRQGLRGADVDAVVAACTTAGVRYRFMPAGDMDKIYPGNHQGFLARLAAGELASLDDVLAATKNAPLPVSLALDRVQDPGNVGTLARTLFALGGGGIIVPKHEGARLGPGAAKASAGTLARLPVAKVSNLSRALDEAAEAGFTILGAAGAAQAQNVHTARPDFPIILVLGSEDEGIRAGVLKRCQTVLRIPQARPLDSINVAQAGAIILGRLASILDQGS